MSNCLFGYPNFAAVATLSGGSWETTLPLTYMQTRYLTQKARSTDDAKASTTFDADLKAQYPIRAVAVLAHNISLAGLVRIRISTAASFATTAYDSGWVTAYPMIYPFGSLVWGAPGFWDGKLAENDRVAGYRQDVIHVVDADTLGRYVRVEVDDTANPDGYIEIGGLFVVPGYQPSINMAVGASIGYKTETAVTAGRASRYFTERPRRRSLAFTLGMQPEDEALVNLFDFDYVAGIHEQFYFIYDPDDTYHLSRRAFPATLASLSPLQMPYMAWGDKAYEITEEL